MGQGIKPEGYHNIADAMSREQLQGFLGDIQRNVNQTVSALPSHAEFITKLVSIAKI